MALTIDQLLAYNNDHSTTVKQQHHRKQEETLPVSWRNIVNIRIPQILHPQVVVRILFLYTDTYHTKFRYS
jgi:hypothetical protein